MEHIDENFLELAEYDKNEPYNALLYRARDKNANFTRYNNLESLYREDYEDFPGGLQPLDKEKDPIRGWSSGFEQRHPDIDEYGEHWRPIKEFSEFAARSTDMEFEQRISQFLDIERYINLWVFMQLVDDSDGLYQNRYIAREKGTIKFYFIPWDKDGVLGRDHKMNKRHHALWLETPLFNRCMKHRWFREALKNTWRDLREKGIISAEKIFAMIDRNAQVLEDARKRNFKRWPTDPRRSPYPDANTFYREIDYMKDWITKRIQWLDDRMATIHSIAGYMEAR
jgi:spore coat protein CotH